MKIDTNTINVLKNFAKINPSIIIPEGNTLKTISPSKTIMAKATVTTEFNKRFAIYNLDQFISTLSLFNNPELDFNDKYVNIFDANESTHYPYADESTITKTPEKEIKLPSVDVTFTITNDNLKNVEKAAGVLGLPEIVVVGDGKLISLQAADTKNPSGAVYSIEIGTTNKTFKAIFKSENIKIIPGDYEVSICSKGISCFKGKEADYWIAVEQSSTF
jgi:gp45 sliding clamp, C terminal